MKQSNILNYFKSVGSFYEFALLETTGESRMNLLNIYKAHYINPDMAKEWYTNIREQITNTEAIEELESIYKNMIEED
ncbi:hypothetical protein [Clostridium paraputrificum]|uniref:hypothetical protein n=1 Tax=Clostridium paraputrificum TaxID=29363 RepID=UPI00189D4127|nr:hypothetical protein [Clostridium paraputrificum]